MDTFMEGYRNRIGEIDQLVAEYRLKSSQVQTKLHDEQASRERLVQIIQQLTGPGSPLEQALQKEAIRVLTTEVKQVEKQVRRTMEELEANQRRLRELCHFKRILMSEEECNK